MDKQIALMKKLCEKEGIKVDVLKKKYPQGGEKVLVYHTTGKVIGNGQLPIDVGCVVSNSSTIAAIGKYLKTGIPLKSLSSEAAFTIQSIFLSL